MSTQRGRPIMAAIFGFLSGLFLAISLLAFGVIPLESILVTALPVIGLIGAFAVAMWVPLGRTKPAAVAEAEDVDTSS